MPPQFHDGLERRAAVVQVGNERIAKAVKDQHTPLSVLVIDARRLGVPPQHAGRRLRNVEYPPFQRVIRGPQAFEKLSQAAQAQYRKNWDMAAKIQPRLKQRTDERAVNINKRIDARNSRVRHLNLIIRQLRGQVLYLLVQTGDPTVLELIGKSIERYIRARSHAAFDMMAYLYRAMSEGYLAQYDMSILEAFGDRLRVIARANQRYVNYSGVTRNFGDYAFHLIETLKEPARLKPPRQLEPDDP